MTRLLVAAALLVFGVAVVVRRWAWSASDTSGANEAIFDELPLFPGSRVRSITSSGYRENESGPVIGYGTLHLVTLPDDARPEEVARSTSASSSRSGGWPRS